MRLIRTEPDSATTSPSVTGANQRGFRPVPGSELDLAADWVVTALGFDAVPCPRTEDFVDLAVNEWGGLSVDGGQMTSIPGVFAGGDIVNGPSLVLHAVRDARRAAARIHAYLAERGPKASI